MTIQDVVSELEKLIIDIRHSKNILPIAVENPIAYKMATKIEDRIEELVRTIELGLED